MILLLTFGIIVLIYMIGKRNHTYWKKKKVVYEKPLPFFGNFARVLFQQVCNSDLYLEMYTKFPDKKYVGMYIGNKPALILRDPELIKCVLQTNFSNFYARGFKNHKDTTEPLMRNLFAADGDLWKMLRQKLYTYLFTGVKLKAMFPIIVEKTKKLQGVLSVVEPKGKDIDAKDLMARYTTDITAACGFGVDTDSLSDELSLFRKLGKRIFAANARDIGVFLLKTISPATFKDLYTLPPECETYVLKIMRTVMKQRNYVPSGRNDFIDYLLELKCKGKISIESIEMQNSDGTPKIVEFTLEELTMAAQVIAFFAAGFETSSSLASFTLHQLAYNLEKQKKCQEEIDLVLCRYHNELCYDAIKSMKYLEMAVRESMRMHPPLGYITRLNANKYTFPGTDLTIDAGISVIIPIQALHGDEKYFPEPETFKPERFYPEYVSDIPQFAYIPFGGGPRYCIGAKLGLMQTMAGIVAILSKYSVEPTKNSIKVPRNDPKSKFVQTIKDGLPLLFVPRKK